jgi:hypothetical protein
MVKSKILRADGKDTTRNVNTQIFFPFFRAFRPAASLLFWGISPVPPAKNLTDQTAFGNASFKSGSKDKQM